MAEARRSLRIGTALLVAALALAAFVLARHVPPGQWVGLTRPDPADMAQVVAAYATLPRLAAAVLAGAALGLCGGLLQQVLRNPLAAPGTLGISAGAQLALAATSLYAPAALALLGRDAIACAGGGGAVALVLALSWRSRLAPVTVLLCGLVVSLYLGSLGGVLVLLHTRQLAGLFVWGAGSLVQLGWDVPRHLLLRLGLAAAVALLLTRPLRLLELPDEMARGLGVPVPLIRLAGLAVAVGLGSAVVGLVGVIGFVGLAAPALVRLADGARPGLWASALTGAGLLAVTDQVVQLGTGATAALLPTGAVTALLGAPLLLVLLSRLAPAAAAEPPPGMVRVARPGPVLSAAALALLAAVPAALLLGRSLDGWGIGLAPLASSLALRAPRVAAAAMAGAMLAVAGLLLQRLLRNPIASPDVLGIGTGTMLGLVAALWWGLDGPLARLGAGAVGGAAGLAVIMAFAGGAAPSRLLLAGLALGAGFEAVLALVLAGGDPRGETLLAWLSGSTYLVDAGMAWSAALCMVVLLALAAAATRWLDLLPLGPEMALAAGLPVGPARAGLLLLAAALTGVATLLVGPLSFVGLLAPHLARLLGLSRAAALLPGAALCGATIMVLADWAGRTVLFPAEIPAGVVAALIGGPLLLWTLTRQTA